MHTETERVAKAMTVVPRLMRYFLGSFKPGVEMPLKKNEIKALFEIEVHPGMPMRHYADAVDMEFGSFTYLCDKLEKKNLVERVQSEDDKRVTVLNLTETGVGLVEIAKEQFDAHVLELIKTLSKEDLDNLSTAINMLDSILCKLEK